MQLKILAKLLKTLTRGLFPFGLICEWLLHALLQLIKNHKEKQAIDVLLRNLGEPIPGRSRGVEQEVPRLTGKDPQHAGLRPAREQRVGEL